MESGFSRYSIGVKLTIVTAKRVSLGGYSGDDVARNLRISGRGVSDCRERGKKILDKAEILGEYLV